MAYTTGDDGIIWHTNADGNRVNSADGIVIGGQYLDYDRQSCIVTGVHHTEDEMSLGELTGRRVTWYTTTTGMFDASRLQRQ